MPERTEDGGGTQEQRTIARCGRRKNWGINNIGVFVELCKRRGSGDRELFQLGANSKQERTMLISEKKPFVWVLYVGGKRNKSRCGVGKLSSRRDQFVVQQCIV